jgi:rare lipoprotein A
MSAQSRKLYREIFPVMAAGLMLSMPAFAADAPKTDTSKHIVKSAVIASKPAPAHKPVVTQHAANSPIKPAAKPVQKPHREDKAPSLSGARSYDSQGRVIRRVAITHNDAASPGFDRALLDDGTFWREDGSQTTWQQTGMASWYGGAKWQGKRTSSGERFDQNQLTAAHATLPIGTQVRVMRTDGRGSVVVTINDRPGSRTRIIDLSRAAAKELGILTAGVTMVTLQPL